MSLCDRHAHALEYLVEHLKPGARVLDVGCGSGVSVIWMGYYSHAQHTGILQYLVGILHELVQPGGKV